jgi:hypothetical protein
VARGYRARIEGTGVVVRQLPVPGTSLTAGQACTLRLGDMAQVLEEERRAQAAAAKSEATLIASVRPVPVAVRGPRKKR